MSFVRRHGMDMDMGSSSLATATSSMSMATSTSDMDDMDGMSMHMYFTTQYKDYPVLFKNLRATNGGEAFGIFLLIFVIAFLTRGIEYFRNYLEQVVWKNPVYTECHPNETISPIETEPTGNCCGSNDDSDESIRKIRTTSYEREQNEGVNKDRHLSLASSFIRDLIRLALCILPELFGFALMLAAMSFTLTYFFAIVLGLGIGRFVFERMSYHYRLKPTGASAGMHC